LGSPESFFEIFKTFGIEQENTEEYKKKIDPLVGRVSTFHTLQTSGLAIFSKIRRKYLKLQNLRIML
jgi:hypothetical protein